MMYFIQTAHHTTHTSPTVSSNQYTSPPTHHLVSSNQYTSPPTHDLSQFQPVYLTAHTWLKSVPTSLPHRLHITCIHFELVYLTAYTSPTVSSNKYTSPPTVSSNQYASPPTHHLQSAPTSMPHHLQSAPTNTPHHQHITYSQLQPAHHNQHVTHSQLQPAHHTINISPTVSSNQHTTPPTHHLNAGLQLTTLLHQASLGTN
jgi:hypothetical protein